MACYSCRCPTGIYARTTLFNIFLSDLFLLISVTDIVNYADDNTPYFCQLDSGLVADSLEISSTKLLAWFSNNRMKANTDKYHFLLTGEKELALNINQTQIKSTKQQKLLGMTFDNKLNFEKHVNNLCNKVSQKINTLTRISNYIQPNPRRLIMKAFITSQFGYCPLVMRSCDNDVGERRRDEEWRVRTKKRRKEDNEERGL